MSAWALYHAPLILKGAAIAFALAALLKITRKKTRRTNPGLFDDVKLLDCFLVHHRVVDA